MRNALETIAVLAVLALLVYFGVAWAMAYP
jgi:hypothetical protein